MMCLKWKHGVRHVMSKFHFSLKLNGLKIIVRGHKKLHYLAGTNESCSRNDVCWLSIKLATIPIQIFHSSRSSFAPNDHVFTPPWWCGICHFLNKHLFALQNYATGVGGGEKRELPSLKYKPKTTAQLWVQVPSSSS